MATSPGQATPIQQLQASVQPFDPPVQRLIRATRAALHTAFPTATTLVFEGYNI